jgi:hypothetical protein
MQGNLIIRSFLLFAMLTITVLVFVHMLNTHP